MKVEESKYSIGELVHWHKQKLLVVNSEYQRGGGLWPSSAKSYFIDTILKDFPFPKIYFYERLDRDTKTPRREIVDGQQRITTIADFVGDEFSLGSNAREFKGCTFSQLPDERQEAFYAYTVTVDVIRNAERSDILQMFRRMNAYTLPLNAPEKRHSEFFGEFKDWVNTVLDEYGSILTNWKVLTSRQIMRMADAEFVADIALALEEGIVSTSPSKLLSLYKNNDQVFPQRIGWNESITCALDVVTTELSPLQGTYMTKPHIFHSLLCALIHNRVGLIGGKEATGLDPIGIYFYDRDKAIPSLIRLAAAHEEKDTAQFGEYVVAASEGGNRSSQRATRIRWICRALRGEFA